MKSIIKQIYDGELCLSERAMACERLETRMCGELKELFEDFISKDISASAFSETQAFMQGFKLGRQIVFRGVFGIG